MKRLKMHAQRVLPYPSAVYYTLCNRRVAAEQLAAFREGVNCRQCLASLQSSDDFAAWLAERRAIEGKPAPAAAE